MTDQPTWLTAEAYAKLKDELDNLQTAGRQELEARLAEARSHGDIRENADYDAAKNDQGLMEARIRQIEHILAGAQVREAKDTGRVEIGSIVTLIDGEGEEAEYLVATPENKVPGHLLASPSGPLGKALLGARVGDEVTYRAPGGNFGVKVVSVRPYRG
ncbi:MAG TPA: transcription elongation factor GreA [Acidimicrobiia bacterium]|jgi:transcription elongation factor GreA